jgi:ElaB/YqjD/DUF883 family membrane-anchored ribosome-binding protein
MDTRAHDSDAAWRGEDGVDVAGARETSRRARAALGREVYILIADVENLLRCVRSAADPELTCLRADVESAITKTRRALAERAHRLRRQAGETLGAGDRYVHQNPWAVIGLTAISALLGGLLLARGHEQTAVVTAGCHKKGSPAQASGGRRSAAIGSRRGTWSAQRMRA